MKRRSLNPIWWWVVFPVIALIGLGLLIGAYPALPAWDAAFLLRLHRYASPNLNYGIAVFTDLGTVWGVLPATLALVALTFWQRRWRESSYLLLTMLGTVILNPLAKLLWHRVRPALWEGVPPQADFSFPSGHATYSLAFVLAMILLTWDSPKRFWIVVVGALFVVLIGLSRVYLGVHYPSDILGGWLLATAWTVGLYGVMFHRWPPSPLWSPPSDQEET
jgi:membrane-associated phospholipid phosphatase